jgi:hypothetical protein
MINVSETNPTAAEPVKSRNVAAGVVILCFKHRDGLTGKEPCWRAVRQLDLEITSSSHLTVCDCSFEYREPGIWCTGISAPSIRPHHDAPDEGVRIHRIEL